MEWHVQLHQQLDEVMSRLEALLAKSSPECSHVMGSLRDDPPHRPMASG